MDAPRACRPGWPSWPFLPRSWAAPAAPPLETVTRPAPPHRRRAPELRRAGRAAARRERGTPREREGPRPERAAMRRGPVEWAPVARARAAAGARRPAG